jgi:hypothetical protein
MRDWKDKWQRTYGESQARNPDRTQQAADAPIFVDKALARHDGLLKHESPVPRTLRDFNDAISKSSTAGKIARWLLK